MLKLSVVLLALYSLTAQASVTPGLSAAQETVQTIVEHAKALDEKAKKLAASKKIEELVDFKDLSLNALSDHAKKMSATQRQKIEDLLKNILTGTVYPKATKFFSDVKIEYLGETQANVDGRELTKVSSVVHKNNKRSKVEYWLKSTPQGMRVVDLAIEGERWVENVQIQFDELIRQKGVSDLIARMQKRANELKSKR